MAIIGCGLILIGATASPTGLAGAEVGFALTGLGMGLATGPLMGAAVGGFPPHGREPPPRSSTSRACPARRSASPPSAQFRDRRRAAGRHVACCSAARYRRRASAWMTTRVRP